MYYNIQVRMDIPYQKIVKIIQVRYRLPVLPQDLLKTHVIYLYVYYK
jgi:hypothetical protein